MEAGPVTPPAPRLSRWRPGPRRLVRLLVGLWIFGAGEGLIVASELGNSPWTVLAEGVSVQSPLGIGTATVLLSFLVLAAWWPLGQRPGLGTLCNAVLVGVALEVTAEWLPAQPEVALAVAELVGGIALVAIGSGLYLHAQLGAGPRDGLMTGLHRRTGRSVRAVRATLELTVLALGAALGGTFGVGTVAFALLIGPAVQVALRVLGRAPAAEL